jgi:4-amino-4-deoxy-L-arabinose transferase-like glycosyltransferase
MYANLIVLECTGAGTLTEKGKDRAINYLAAALLAFAVFFALYSVRAVDDNRLTSWAVVFRSVDVMGLMPPLVFGAFAAYVLSGRRFPGLAALGAGSFLAAVLFWREPEMLVDASRYFTQAKHLALYGPGYFLEHWGRGIEAWTDLPLVPFLYGLSFKVFGESRLTLQVLTSLMFSSTVVLTSLIGRDLWDRTTGDMGGAFLMAMPFLYTQVPQVLVDVPSMFFLTLAVYAFRRALREGGPGWFALSAGAISAAALSKYSLWLMLSLLFVILLVSLEAEEMERRRALALRGLKIVALGAIIPILFVLYKLDVVSGQMFLLFTYQKAGLDRWTESFTSTYLFHVHPFLTAAALYSVYAAKRKGDFRYVMVVWLVFLMVLLGIRRIRYLIPVFPMLALMASYGIQDIEKERLRRFVVLLAVSFSLVIGVFAYVPFLRTNSISNLMHAGRFLDTLDGEVARVDTLPQKSMVNPATSVPLLDIYTGKKILYDYEFSTHLTQGEIAASSLRFTWEYANPPYYVPDEDAAADLLVLITPGPAPRSALRQRGYGFLRRFDVSAGLYRYIPFVEVYKLQKE